MKKLLTGIACLLAVAMMSAATKDASKAKSDKMMLAGTAVYDTVPKDTSKKDTMFGLLSFNVSDTTPTDTTKKDTTFASAVAYRMVADTLPTDTTKKDTTFQALAYNR